MPRDPDSTTITISMTKVLRDQIDARAARLHMDRSTYLRQLCLREFGGAALPSMELNKSAESSVEYRIKKKSRKAGT